MRIFFGGDICVSQPLAKTPVSDEVADLFFNCEARIANWEAPILGSTTPSKQNKVGPHLYQRQGHEFFLVDNFLTHVSLANNHIMDFGADGLKETLLQLEKYNIPGFGAGLTSEASYSPLVIEDREVKIALLSLSEAQFGCDSGLISMPGYAWISHSNVFTKIKALKQQVDFIVVCAHAGLEMASMPLPQWRMIYRQIIDFGADLIVGSHPHLIQGKEVYKEKIIYYSLGNLFFNNGDTSSEWSHSLAIDCSFVKGQPLKINEHFLKQGVSSLSLEHSGLAKKRFMELSDILQANNFTQYYQKTQDEVLNAWESVYRFYYGFKVPREEFFLQRLFDKVFNRYYVSNSESMILHNIKIESHRFAVENALKVRNQML